MNTAGSTEGEERTLEATSPPSEQRETEEEFEGSYCEYEVEQTSCNNKLGV